MPHGETIELRWFLGVMRRRIWLIVGCVLLALLLAFFITSQRPPAYEASTTLLVIPATQMNTSEYNTLLAGRLLALTYAQMLEERSTLAAVIERLGLETTPEELAPKIQARPIEDTQLVRVTAKGSSPEQAALIANTLAEIFAESTNALQETRYRDYLADKEAQLTGERKLMTETQALVDGLSRAQISDEAELTRLQGVLEEIRSNYRTLLQDRQALRRLLEEAQGQIRIVEKARPPTAGPWLPESGATPPARLPSSLSGTRAAYSASRVPPSYTADVTLLIDQGQVGQGTEYSGILASERLAATYAEIATGATVLGEALSRLGTGHSPDALQAAVTAEPIAGTQLLALKVKGTDVVRTTNLANAIAAAFVEQIRAMRGEPYAGRLASTEAEIARLSTLIDGTQAQLLARTEDKLKKETERARLQDRLAELQTNHRALQQSYEQLRLAATQASDAIIITDRAHAPQKPVRNQYQYILLAALAALLAASGVAFVAEYQDDTIKTPDEVGHALGLNTIGMIEQFDRSEKELIVASHPHSPAAESYRVLAANLRLSGAEDHPRTILVTSPAPGEGKSVLAANLAVALAGVGQRVVLVDADLRLPRQHVIYGLDRDGGLTEALVQGAVGDRVRSTAVAGVRLLTCGTLPLDPVVALSSPQMQQLLAALAAEAEFVLIDSAPALPMADALYLAAKADGVLLLLQAGHTSTKTARRGVDALRQAGAQLIGIVLNAVPVERGDRYRYYESRGPDSRFRLRRKAGAQPTPVSGKPG
jgi:capsular exopolysaccharide synthesis family protein